MVLLTSPPLLLLLLTSTASCTFTKDASRKISVVELASGRLEVVAGHRVSARVVAWATLEDEQGESGWYTLEVSTRASAQDPVQARAAGGLSHSSYFLSYLRKQLSVSPFVRPHF